MASPRLPESRPRQPRRLHSDQPVKGAETEGTPSYAAFYLPGPEDLPTQQALALGLQWLLRQPGQPLVVLSSRSLLKNNRLLSDAVQEFEVTVALPRLCDTSWSGGSLLFWASAHALLDIDAQLTGIQAMCVIVTSRHMEGAWILEHHARDLRHRETAIQTPRLAPIVQHALSHASQAIDHGDALIRPDAYAHAHAHIVQTLQTLVRAGHRYEVENVVAWARNNGWHEAEIPLLRKSAQGVLNGLRLRPSDECDPIHTSQEAVEARGASLHTPGPIAE